MYIYLLDYSIALFLTAQMMQEPGFNIKFNNTASIIEHNGYWTRPKQVYSPDYIMGCPLWSQW